MKASPICAPLSLSLLPKPEPEASHPWLIGPAADQEMSRILWNIPFHGCPVCARSSRFVPLPPRKEGEVAVREVSLLAWLAVQRRGDGDPVVVAVDASRYSGSIMDR